MPPVIKDVLGDGDCFFRALFRAAWNHGLIERLLGCFSLGQDTNCHDILQELQTGRLVEMEDEMVKCMRIGLSERIRLNADVKFACFFNHLRHLQREHPETFDVIMESQSDWVKKIFYDGSLYGEDEFRVAYAKGLRTRKNWVAQYDVELLKHLMNKCHLEVRVVNFTDKTNPRTYENRHDNELVLVNFDEVHFKYVLQDGATDEF